MDIQNLITTIAVGAVAGWIASLILKRGLGLLATIIVGVVGALVGSYLFHVFGISVGSGIAAAIISAVAGSVVVLVLLGLLKK